MSYIFGGDTGETPESLRKKREIADMLAMSIRTPKNVGEGLGAVGNAIAYRAISGKANKAEEAGRAQGSEAFNSIIGSLMGGSQPSSYGASPTASPSVSTEPMDYPTQRVSQASGMDPLKDGIMQTANALQMDPVDLATIISYETAGTFDPTKKGPTTQWGQHRGLIQFGEPQARDYGVDWSRPMESQLGPDGAVANYFRDNGWKPGMGMLDAYSIVNAGGPGRYNASDANNGGAPGTVRDKVDTQMADHRAKAAALFGGEQLSPAPAANGAQQPVQVAQSGSGISPDVFQQMQNPWLTEGQQGIINMLLQQQMQRSDPSNQLDMEYKREQLNQLRNPTPKTTTINGNLVNSQTGEVIGSYPDPSDAPTVQTLELPDGSEVAVQWDAQRQDWVPIDAPEGGGTANPKNKLTESQSKLTLFQSLQTETQPVLLDLEKRFNPGNLPDAFAGGVLGGNFFRTQEGQIYDSAATAWAEGALRIATGAAATPEEMQRTKKAYFAQPGDSPATIQFKAQMRNMYDRSIQRALGSTDVEGNLPLPSEFAGVDDGKQGRVEIDGFVIEEVPQ